MRLMVLIASAALISTSALATDPPNQIKKAVDPGQKIVCKTEEFVGSIIPRRICKTKADWVQGAIDAKAALDQHHTADDPKKLCGC